MAQTYKATNSLHYLLLRTSKEDSYFLYFTFEANEGLCWYSTREDSLKGQYRDIEVWAPVELTSALRSLVERLQQEIRLDVLEEKTVSDSGRT